MTDHLQLTVDGRETPVLAPQPDAVSYEQSRMFDHAPSVRGQLAMSTDQEGSMTNVSPELAARIARIADHRQFMHNGVTPTGCRVEPGGEFAYVDLGRVHGPHDGLAQAHRDAHAGDHRGRLCIGAVADADPSDVAAARAFYAFARCVGFATTTPED